MTLSTKRSAVILGLLLFAFALRVWGLDRDPPRLEVLPDESTWTDEGTVALPAVDVIRGGLSITDGVILASRPLHEISLYIAFKFLGLGRYQGRLVSVAVGMVGLAVVARLARLAWSDVGPFLALAFAGSGFFFLIYDRLILTEGIVVALLSLIALIGIRSRGTRDAIIVGVCLGIAAVTLKLHALALLPALACFYAVRRKHLLIPFLVGVAFVFLIWRVSWVSQNTSYAGYLEDRIGSPSLGMFSPDQMIVRIFLAGLPVSYLPYQIPLLLLASLEVLSLLLSPRRWFCNVSDVILVALVWLVTVLVAASLFRYAPTRYFHIASPALVLLAISGARRLWLGHDFPDRSIFVRVVVAIALGLVLLIQVAPPLPMFGDEAKWVPLLGTLLIPVFLWLSTRTRAGWDLTMKTRAFLLAALVSIQFLLQGGLYFAGVVQSRADLARVASSLVVTLPPNAIVAGRLAGSLALFAPLRTVPTLYRVDRGVLENLAQNAPVWYLVISGDEENTSPGVWPFLVYGGAFPIQYDRKGTELLVCRFIEP